MTFCMASIVLSRCGLNTAGCGVFGRRTRQDVGVKSQRSVTLETLGAWVIKCNPRVTSVEPFLATGEAKRSWCVADNYRSQLIRPGHRVLFWVSAHPRRGIWGAGRVTGDVSGEPGELRMAVSIRLLASPLTAVELSTLPGLGSMEVFRSPQQANPSWVSAAELAIIEPLLPATMQSHR
jgi:hypothetical protein